MSFLDKLGDIGIGRTDNRAAGSASYLADTLKGAVASQARRDKQGMEQEMLAMTQGGKQINLEQMKMLSQKYDLPVSEVFQTTTVANKRVQADRMKKFNQAVTSKIAAHRAKNGKLDNSVLPKIIQETGEELGMGFSEIAAYEEIRRKGFPQAKKTITKLGPQDIAVDQTGAKIAENTNIKPVKKEPKIKLGTKQVIKKTIDGVKYEITQRVTGHTHNGQPIFTDVSKIKMNQPATSGALTEGAVSKDINDTAIMMEGNFEQNKAILKHKHRKLVKGGMSREDALVKVMMDAGGVKEKDGALYKKVEGGWQRIK